MTNLEYLKTTTNDDDFASELYSVIHKIDNNNVTLAELSDILNKEHSNVTKVLCYIITRDVNKAEFDTYNDVNIECHDTIVKDGYLFIFGADEIYSLNDFINKYKNKYDTLILQYTQGGVRKSYVNGNHVDDIVFAG